MWIKPDGWIKGKRRELSIALRKSGFATVTCICQTWVRGLQFTLFSKAKPKTTWQIKEFPCSLNTYETTPDWTQEPRTKVAHKTKNTSRASNYISIYHALNFMKGTWQLVEATRRFHKKCTWLIIFGMAWYELKIWSERTALRNELGRLRLTFLWFPALRPPLNLI